MRNTVTTIAVFAFAMPVTFAQTTPAAPPATTPAVPQTTPAAPINNAAQPPPAATPGTPSTAASGQNVPLDLQRSVQLSLNASTALTQARRNLESDADRIDEARAAYRPTVTGSGSATRFDAPTNIRIGGGPPVTALHEHNETLTLAVAQRLDFTGQIRAATSQARLQRLADEITVQNVSLSRTLQAKTAYYTLLRANGQVTVAEAALVSAIQQRDTAKKLYEGQIGQKIDYLRAETAVAQAEQDLTAANNTRDVSRANFNNILGRPLTTPVDVSPVDVPTDATAVASEVSGINLDTATNDALKTRPEVLNAEVQIRIADTGIKLARAGQEPNFSVGANANYYPTPSFQFPRQKTAALTAAVTIPFYDGGVTRDRINSAKARVDNAKSGLAGDAQ